MEPQRTAAWATNRAKMSVRFVVVAAVRVRVRVGKSVRVQERVHCIHRDKQDKKIVHGDRQEKMVHATTKAQDTSKEEQQDKHVQNGAKCFQTTNRRNLHSKM